MSITASNIILGPGTLYTAVFGAVEPLPAALASAPDSLVWTDVGATTDGVNMALNQDFTEIAVDQVVQRLASRKVKEEATVHTNLAEATLENLAVALNGATVASGSGWKSLEPNYATSATQPTYRAILIDGFAPGGFRRRLIVRKVLSTANVELAYKKDAQTVMAVTFTAHYVSDSIAPYKWWDATS